MAMENDGGGNQSFFMCRYFCEFLLLLPNFSSEICYLPQNPGRRYKFCKMTKKLMFVLKCGRNCGRIIETSVFTERQ